MRVYLNQLCLYSVIKPYDGFTGFEYFVCSSEAYLNLSQNYTWVFFFVCFLLQD